MMNVETLGVDDSDEDEETPGVDGETPGVDENENEEEYELKKPMKKLKPKKLKTMKTKIRQSHVLLIQ